MSSPFRNRTEAGRQLAARLARYRGEDAVVLALPRGGVPVAFEVASALALPLDVIVVRKLGAPDRPELGMGAVAEGGACYVDPELVAAVGASDEEVEAIAARENAEVERRVRRWRGHHAPSPLEGKTAIVVDDGIATGGTVRAALRCLKARRPRNVILAVPVAPRSTLEELAPFADEIVCLEPVHRLGSVGEWYLDFTQVADEEVAALLRRAAASRDMTA